MKLSSVVQCIDVLCMWFQSKVVLMKKEFWNNYALNTLESDCGSSVEKRYLRMDEVCVLESTSEFRKEFLDNNIQENIG